MPSILTLAQVSLHLPGSFSTQIQYRNRPLEEETEKTENAHLRYVSIIYQAIVYLR